MHIEAEAHFCCAPARGRGGIGRAPPAILLRDTAAEALAVLVPLLGCGEEAATLAFDALAGCELDAGAAQALALIGAEERAHENRGAAGLQCALHFAGR